VPRKAGAGVVIRAADPIELARIVARLFRVQQRFERHAAVESRELGAVLRHGVGKAIHQDEAAGARHVLDHNRRIARNVPAQDAGQRAGVEVVAATGGEADADGDGLAAIEIGACILRGRLRWGRGYGRGKDDPIAVLSQTAARHDRCPSTRIPDPSRLSHQRTIRKISGGNTQAAARCGAYDRSMAMGPLPAS
jgi:hypothetical protein